MIKKYLFPVILTGFCFTAVFSQQTRACLFGDPQSITYDNLIPAVENIYRYVASLNPGLVLIGGDLNEHGEIPRFQDTLFAILRRTGVYSEPNTRFYPAIGDHDCIGMGSLDSAGKWAEWKTRWQDRVDLPGNETYYSVIKNNICVINVLQSSEFLSIRPGNTQYNWLVQELKKADENPAVDWIIVAWHYPPLEISAAVYGGASYDQPYMCRLMRDNNVDIVLTGHQHNLFRTYPVTFQDNGSAVSPQVVGPGEGTTFLAASRSELAIKDNAPCYYHAIAVGSNTSGTDRNGNTGLPCRRDAIWRIDFDGLTAKGYGENTIDPYKGEVFDTFTVAPRPKTGGGGTQKEAKAEAEAKGGITVSPNPFKGLVNINYELQIMNYELKDINLAIYDIHGRCVKDLTKEIHNSSFIICNLSGFPAGVYLVRANIGGRVLSRRITLTR